jgi:hypothetical protein
MGFWGRNEQTLYDLRFTCSHFCSHEWEHREQISITVEAKAKGNEAFASRDLFRRYLEIDQMSISYTYRLHLAHREG